MKAKLHKNRSGTALIVALLVMGVLMAISLALSALVLRESVVTREFLDAGQSFYAAESASEIGLYGVKNNLPGWEPRDGVPVPISVGENAVAELKVSNKCRAYPCFDGGYDLSNAAPEAFYATLGLNESATIPLFVADGKGGVTDITGFRVQFYSKFTKDDFKTSIKNDTDLSDWDVLRWKIVGFSKTNEKPTTESISDFTAVSFFNDGNKSTAKKPSWFGSDACGSIDGIKDLYIKIDCIDYGRPAVTETNKFPCTVIEAREFYLYTGFTDEDRKNKLEHCWPLSTFINDHKLNYLTLTNLVNPSMFEKTKESDEKTKLFYRVELFANENPQNTSSPKVTSPTVRDFADITADGYSGRSKQSVNVKIKRDSFMPVFNFSLYSTYMDKEGKDTENNVKHDEEYWYGKKTTDTQTLGN